MAARSTVVAIGADGCRGGWLAGVARRSDGGLQSEVRLFRRFDDLLGWRKGEGDEAVVGVDIPIGLPRRVEFRGCDREARVRLGERRNSVFQPPARYLLGAADYSEVQARVERAKAESGHSTGGLSRQAFGILRKVEEVDRAVVADPDHGGWLCEVHPEVSFVELTGQELPPKASASGRAARRNALRSEFPDLPTGLEAAELRTREAAVDDALDAFAALWSALRFRANQAETLGGGGDELGLPMRIVV
jgi:predicted RNase H-like nuclease